VIPALVALPHSADEVAAVVRACAEAGVPFVARGSGTGLSGGALPHAQFDPGRRFGPGRFVGGL
jgi:glycolate oxidase